MCFWYEITKLCSCKSVENTCILQYFSHIPSFAKVCLPASRSYCKMAKFEPPNQPKIVKKSMSAGAEALNDFLNKILTWFSQFRVQIWLILEAKILPKSFKNRFGNSKNVQEAPKSVQHLSRARKSVSKRPPKALKETQKQSPKQGLAHIDQT